jgi:transposase-like protein
VKVAASGATSTVRSTSSATRQPRFVTDRAPVYAGVLEELLPSVWHRTDRYANNQIEADHGRLKARLYPMRGLKQDHSARPCMPWCRTSAEGTTTWRSRNR